MRSILFTLIVFLLAGCAAASAPAASPTPDAARTATFAYALQAATRSLPTLTPTATHTLRPTATTTPTPTPTPLRTPPALPGVFRPQGLDPLSLPQTYITDTCAYLKARWDPHNSPPGTVVMVIMYHSITEDTTPLAADGSQVHHSDLVRTLEHAYETGFQTITTAQLVDFLYHNARIPPRSLLIIVDDRKRSQYYETHFLPFLEKYNWTITNAWISAADTPEYLWQENLAIQAAGWVDPQAHGVVHNIPIGEYSTDEYIRSELVGSMETIRARFGKTPLGFIWPGGGFTRRAVELAREVGYQVGFTTNPRGPLMYNWIPQAEKSDPAHPFWLPEIPAGDPLLTLPRYWSIDAAYRLDEVANMGEEAAAWAAQHRQTELEYYDIVCKPITGAIPTLTTQR